jgi:hypothetical protein
MLALGLVPGCGSIPIYPQHVLLYDSHGLPLDSGQGPSRPRATAYQAIPPDRHYDDAIASILEGYDSWMKDRPPGSHAGKGIMLIIHGGLMDQDDSEAFAGKILSDGISQDYYPVFICWKADVTSAYVEHLSVWRGVKWPWWTPFQALLTGATDMVRGFADLPLALAHALGRPFENQIIGQGGGTLGQEFKVSGENGRLPLGHGNAASMDLVFGKDEFRFRDYLEAGYDAYIPLFWPSKLLCQYALVANGPPAWNIMLRRTQLLFQNERDSGWDYYKDEDPGLDLSSGEGALTVFLRALQAMQSQSEARGDGLHLALAAHSMGTFIANSILRKFPGLKFDTIVYMGAACSVRAYQNAVWTYLSTPSNRDAQFYSLSLNEFGEDRQKEAWGLAPRGSLLVWIDEYLGNPNDRLDRCAGRMANFVDAIGMTPYPLRGRIHVKEFPALHVGDPRAGAQIPQAHGDFIQGRFWKPEYYGSHDQLISKTSDSGTLSLANP